MSNTITSDQARTELAELAPRIADAIAAFPVRHGQIHWRPARPGPDYETETAPRRSDERHRRAIAAALQDLAAQVRQWPDHPLTFEAHEALLARDLRVYSEWWVYGTPLGGYVREAAWWWAKALDNLDRGTPSAASIARARAALDTDA